MTRGRRSTAQRPNLSFVGVAASFESSSTVDDESCGQRKNDAAECSVSGTMAPMLAGVRRGSLRLRWIHTSGRGSSPNRAADR